MNNLHWRADSRYTIGHELVLLAPSHALINVHVRGEAMTSIDSTHELIPVKQCSKCKQILPATLEYFSQLKTGKYGLRANCKKCCAAYHREYYRKHGEKVRNHIYQYREAIHETILERDRQYRSANSDKRAAYALKYREINREKLAEKRLQYRRAHRKEMALYLRQYRKQHPSVMRNYSHRRRARKVNAEHGGTPFDEKAQLKRQKSRCYYCGEKLTKYHVEHCVPLSRGGSDHPDNKVLACPSCNMSKNAKLPHEWSKGGRLL